MFVTSVNEAQTISYKKNKGEKYSPHVKQALKEIIGERVAKLIATAGDLEKTQSPESSTSSQNDQLSKATTAYISIIIDNKVTRWVCRFSISKRSKIMYMPTNEKIRVESVSELYKHKELLLQSAQRYL